MLEIKAEFHQRSFLFTVWYMISIACDSTIYILKLKLRVKAYLSPRKKLKSPFKVSFGGNVYVFKP